MTISENTDIARLVGWADGAIAEYEFAAGLQGEASHCVLSDLLADLHHWANAHDVSWEMALDRARTHYQAEQKEDE